MKKQIFYVLIFASLTSCRWHDNGNTDISYSEGSHYYSMKAHFNKNKTRKVESYMDERIGDRSNMSFVNTRIDGQIALDDHTTFYIKKYPGFLEIKFNKGENSYESYQRIKAMCQGIKEVVGGKIRSAELFMQEIRLHTLLFLSHDCFLQKTVASILKIRS